MPKKSNNFQPSEVDEGLLRELIDLLNVLSNKECLVYLNSTWNLATKWFKNVLYNSSNEIDQDRFNFIVDYIEKEFDEYYNSNDVNEFVVKNTSSKLSKLFLIISDASDLVLNKILIQLNDRLCSANKYVYMPSIKIDKSLYILNNMLKIVKGSFPKKKRNVLHIFYVFFLF
jgi:hypothetical protein